MSWPEGNQYSRGGSFGRTKSEEYDDEDDDEDDENSESDDEDYEGEDDEDDDGRPYRKQRRASFTQHGKDADAMHDDGGRLYSPTGRGTVRG